MMDATLLRCRPRDRLLAGLLFGVTVLAGGRGAGAQKVAPVAAPATPPTTTQTPTSTQTASTQTANPDPFAKPAAPDSVVKLPPEQLQALVAPIALYPDALLAQTLVASTYPLEIVQLQQWMEKHPGLKDKALADSIAKQPWDPSIQSMAPLPDLVKRLADDIQWTTDLGNAFLGQQADVMDAVQVMRKKAKEKGALESNEQQKVETKVVETKQVIVVESANPEVIYVPSYSPTVVYGPAPYPYYPYPPIYYPPYPVGGVMVSFGIGMMWGAAMWGGSCCYAGWGGGNVYINNGNNFVGGVGGVGGSAVSAALAVSVALAGWVVSVAWEVWAAPAVWVVRAVSGVPASPAVSGVACRGCRQARRRRRR